MSRKDTKIFTGRIFPSDLKTTKPRARTASVDWKNTSDRGESLSDPRWHKRPPTKDKQMKKTKLSPQYQPIAQVTDARDLITGSKITKDNPWRHHNPNIHRNKRMQFTNNYATNSSIKHSHTNNDTNRDGKREIVYIDPNK